VTLEELQKALPTDSILVDLLQYTHASLVDAPNGKKRNDESRLVAFVIRRGQPVQLLNLGPTAPLSEAIDTWRKAFGMQPGTSLPRVEGATAGRLLRERIWEPLESSLQDAKLVLVSPDGALSKLPLGALPGKKQGKYLIEEYAIALVPAPQLIPQLLNEPDAKQPPKNLLLLGNVDYDAKPGQPSPPSPVQQARAFGRKASVPRGARQHFDPLPETNGEIATIEKMYRRDFGQEGVTTLDGGRATKRAFWDEVSRHRYLHLATHGFFAADKVQATPAALVERNDRIEGGDPVEQTDWAKQRHHEDELSTMHPGLCSGLALAGANRAAKEDESQDENGILTAEEIGTMNLDGVQLVMLSACETGLGKEAGGEGLLGLQRAFQAAGARTVVASLWSVPDVATRVLMEKFYQNHWEKN
jgi:CHAT domain-containing protein